ncbi:non-ribosomal peptide synthase [Plesiocystis pacifica SIR-1]|uniref:Non-ribosomal peptide synthase n=2 Tax=Plesiocystis pacifica TaxID=191768 RepID=A6G174_9BACT|nr:non-ribosomal peptide synthase [Plesiocystis pacifica SIR-1]
MMQRDPSQTLSSPKPTVAGDAALRAQLDAATTLVDVLHIRAQLHPETPLYQTYVDGEIRETLTYAEADRRARALAVELRRIHPQLQTGDRVLLLYPFGLEYPAVFLGCLYAGLTAVPAFPPDKKRAVKTMPRVSAIIRDADARLILTNQELIETVEFARAEAEDPEALLIDASGGLGRAEADADAWTRPDALAGELAFLQYTSGSTGTPRGVMIGHDNLLAHQRFAHEKFAQPEGSVTVSWLPFYHDMGLIGSLLYPLYCGGTTALMSPTAFLRRPMAWLDAISKLRARVSTGPNFAYELCVQRVEEADIEGLDLSHWELTISGAEPLRPATIQRFCERFAPAGFNPQTFMPCFGMAETTLMVSGAPKHALPRYERFDKAQLLGGQAVLAADGALEADSRVYVSCGTPMSEHEVAIVDPETHARRPEGRQGEIWVRGPSVGRGYWGDPETSTRRFAGRIRGEEPSPSWPWFRTDDTGFVHDGELYGTGRLADLLVSGGQVHQPHDLERDVSEGDAPLAKDAVAFMARGERGEPLVCLAATGRRSMAARDREAVCEAIFERILAEHGLALDRVLLIPPRTVAKTTSGKLRRYRYRQAMSEGELELLCLRERGPARGKGADPRSKTLSQCDRKNDRR